MKKGNLKTIVLIHGWSPLLYNNIASKIGIKDSWYNRQDFISILGKKYNLFFYTIPGFCGRVEPKTSFWKLEDFANDFNNWLISEKIDPDLVLGYSFGGAIAVDWKLHFNKDVKIILIASALLRKSTGKSSFGKLFNFLSGVPLLGFLLKHFYLLCVNKYYRLGTSFLRKSYDSIVREDLSNKILEIKKGEALFIYGNNDTATPWSNIATFVQNSGNPYLVVKNGGHNIGQTHPNEIIGAIIDFDK